MRPLRTTILATTAALVGLLAVAAPGFAAGPPGPTTLNGQPVLTLINREPPGVRCNNNMQVAAELQNRFKVPFVSIPVSLAGPGAKAPAVYYGDELIAIDGGQFNGMVSFTQMRDVVDIGGAPLQSQEGRLGAVKKEFDALKSAIKDVK